MWQRLSKVARWRDIDGQGLVEYGLILSLITLIAIASLQAPGQKMNEILIRVSDSLNSVT